MALASARYSRNPNICPSCSSLADTMDDEEQDRQFCHEMPKTVPLAAQAESAGRIASV